MLTGINLHPVKSLAGVPASAAEVESWGLRHDRRWLVLEPDGTVLTARENHAMLGVTAAPRDGGVTLTARDGSSVDVDEPVDAALVATSLSRLESVRVAPAAANAWLSDQLNAHVRLGWLDDPRRRTVSAAHGGRRGDVLNLADAGPLLLTTSASLARLNAWIAEGAEERNEVAPEMPMIRFRPTVVVDGDSPAFAEDAWSRIRIGAVEFRFGEHCDRCVLTTIDPRTLAGGKEPLRTLARHRQWNHKTYFGVRLIPASTGTIRIGDPVEAE